MYQLTLATNVGINRATFENSDNNDVTRTNNQSIKNIGDSSFATNFGINNIEFSGDSDGSNGAKNFNNLSLNQHYMQPRAPIFVVISVLVVTLLLSSVSAFNVFAAPNAAPSNAECKEYTTTIPGQGFTTLTDCCWTETDPNDPEGIELYYCQECSKATGNCGERRPASQGPTPPPSGPIAPLQGGVLDQQEQQTPPTFAPGANPGVLEQLEQGGGFSPGFLQQQEQLAEDQGAAELPATVCQEGQEFNEDLGFCVPTECPEGQELNEEGLCVLEEQEVIEEQEEPPAEEQSEPQSDNEEQTFDQGDSSEENSNN